MNIGVIGGGSIGLLIGSYLASKHHMTIYVRRKEQMETINTYGLLLNQTKIHQVKSLLLTNVKNEDCLIICVKQPQLKCIIPFIQKTRKNIPLIFLQNGM